MELQVREIQGDKARSIKEYKMADYLYIGQWRL